MSGKDFFNILKRLDINLEKFTPETFNWLFCEDDTRDLLLYFCNYIDESNILTEEEIRQYEFLESEELIVKDDDLEEALNELEIKYPGLLDIEETDINIIEDELKQIQFHYQKIIELNNDQIALNSDITKQIQTHKNIYDGIMIQITKSSDNCVSLSHDLESLQIDLKSQIKEILMCINTTNIRLDYPKISFLCEMPVKNYVQLCKYMNLFTCTETQKNLQKTHKDVISPHFLPDHLPKLKARLAETIRMNIVTKFELSYNEESIRVYNMGVNVPSGSVIDIDNICLEQEIVNLESEMTSLLSELETVSKNAAEVEIQKFISNYGGKKLQRRNHTLEKLKNLNKIITDAENETKMLLYLMESEVDHVACINTLLVSFVENEAVNSEKYAARYKAFKNWSKPSTCSYLLNPILKCLSRIFADEVTKWGNIVDTLAIIDKFEDDFENIMKMFYVDSFCSETKQFIPVERAIKVVSNILWDGPTSKPVYVDTLLYKNMCNTKNMYDQWNTLYFSKVAKFKNIKIKFLDKWYKWKQLYWILFLTEPKKVLRLLNEIEKLNQ